MVRHGCSNWILVYWTLLVLEGLHAVQMRDPASGQESDEERTWLERITRLEQICRVVGRRKPEGKHETGQRDTRDEAFAASLGGGRLPEGGLNFVNAE